MNEGTKGRLPPGQRVTNGFPVFTCGTTPRADAANWDLTIHGTMVARTRWSFAELRNLPTTTIRADFHCVTGWSNLDNEWAGVSAHTLLQGLKIEAPVRCVMVHCDGDYATNLRWTDFLRQDVLFAYSHNGHDISPEHGWPLRLVVPSLYGWKSAKWVRVVELLSEEKPGYWETRGYHMHGDPWNEDRFSRL
jgi:DMSO/TMAO reductase YedYZ molybdopterin-dependent catalytic subunit